ncbi:MAG: 7-cyano-7-deazaguanine synthase QueC [Methanomicrobiales archaeon]|nr:7-cyano-7-deazaguanine synthase QueC [Methanomicrobiales archaeon]
MMEEKLAVCLMSGGMDSTTLAYLARHQGYRIIGLHLNYGQRTENKELRCARRIADLVGAIEFIEISLDYLTRFGGSSLTDRSIAVEEYDPAREAMPNTYVPFRNANLLSIATSLAEARGASAIFIGAQAQDYSGYPDCRAAFIEAFQQVITLGTRDGSGIRLIAPFLDMKKADILRIGLTLGVPYQETWSCYKDSELACGRCGSCHFRTAAFAEVGIRDPIFYEGE